MPGVSNQFIALELLERKGFDKEIIKKAQKVNQEICHNVEKVRPKRKLKKRIQKKKNTNAEVSDPKTEKAKARKETGELSK